MGWHRVEWVLGWAWGTSANNPLYYTHVLVLMSRAQLISIAVSCRVQFRHGVLFEAIDLSPRTIVLATSLCNLVDSIIQFVRPVAKSACLPLRDRVHSALNAVLAYASLANPNRQLNTNARVVGVLSCRVEITVQYCTAYREHCLFKFNLKLPFEIQ